MIISYVSTHHEYTNPKMSQTTDWNQTNMHSWPVVQIQLVHSQQLVVTF